MASMPVYTIILLDINAKSTDINGVKVYIKVKG